MITIELPWPAVALSPNASCHWSIKARAKANYNLMCRVQANNARMSTKGFRPLGTISLELEFHPTDNRRYDLDNLIARMKSGIDGVFAALGMDDYAVDRMTSRIIRDEKQKRGIVIMTVRKCS